MTHPFNHFYVRKLVKITSKFASNRNKFLVAKYSKRVNFGETSLKIIEKLERIRYGTQIMNMMSQYWNIKIQLGLVLFYFCDKESI